MAQNSQAAICLDERYSTTRMVVRGEPGIEGSGSKTQRQLFLPAKPERIDCGGLRTAGYFKSSSDDKPLISVVTVVRNNAGNLEETISSVLGQSYENIEYIVIDGGSDDGTLDIIKKYDNQIDYWISEPDKGISEALNKGLSCQTGEWVNFLSSGDCFVDRYVIERNLEYFRDQSRCIITGFSRFGRITIPKTVRANHEALQVKALISSEASFVRRRVHEKIGYYDESLKVRMDYDFWMRALGEFDFTFLDEILVDYAVGGFSGRNIRLFYKEEMAINKRCLKNYWAANSKALLKCAAKLALRWLELY